MTSWAPDSFIVRTLLHVVGWLVGWLAHRKLTYHPCKIILCGGSNWWLIVTWHSNWLIIIMWNLIVAHWSVCSDEEDGSPVITREGFQFLLLDTPSQVWYFILQYLDTVESRGLDLVDCLTFLFQLSFSTMGKVWSSYHTYDDKFSLVRHDVDFHRDVFTKCARCVLCINSSPWFNCTAELLSPCHSVCFHSTLAHLHLRR